MWGGGKYHNDSTTESREDHVVRTVYKRKAARTRSGAPRPRRPAPAGAGEAAGGAAAETCGTYAAPSWRGPRVLGRTGTRGSRGERPRSNRGHDRVIREATQTQGVGPRTRPLFVSLQRRPWWQSPAISQTGRQSLHWAQ